MKRIVYANLMLNISIDFRSPFLSKFQNWPQNPSLEFFSLKWDFLQKNGSRLESKGQFCQGHISVLFLLLVVWESTVSPQKIEWKPTRTTYHQTKDAEAMTTNGWRKNMVKRHTKSREGETKIHSQHDWESSRNLTGFSFEEPFFKFSAYLAKKLSFSKQKLSTDSTSYAKLMKACHYVRCIKSWQNHASESKLKFQSQSGKFWWNFRAEKNPGNQIKRKSGQKLSF